MKQRQFLDVIGEAVAHERFEGACAHLVPSACRVPLADSLGRVLAEDVRAPVDVPAFDRSNVDGFAVHAADTYGAEEWEPIRLEIESLTIAAGDAPPEGFELPRGSAVSIATGAVVPRGADAVVMVEYTALDETGVETGDAPRLLVQRAVAPGAFVAWAGTDLGRGEIVVRRGQRLTSRDTGLLAAVGVDSVSVVARPRVAIASTGDEIVAPGGAFRPGAVYDSNARILADACTECGAEPISLGIFPDDEEQLHAGLLAALTGDDAADVVLLSGGTSKGAGDLNGRAVERLASELPDSPGVLVHGVALKPGKPILMAVVAGRAVVVLPGFPTSAIFTFHEFVAPLLRRLAGLPEEAAATAEAVAPLRMPSAEGRTEYCLVNLVEGPQGLSAYPLGAGSGSVSTFSRADGFVRIPEQTEYVSAGAPVTVRLLGDGARAADLVAIGSHCIGLDWLLSRVGDRGLRTKAIAIGSTGGLAAISRGEGDVAGIHLLDPETGEYNLPLLPPGVELIRGYGRRQGLVYRRGDPRFEGRDSEPLSVAAFIERARGPGFRMVNRNAGSGTRILLDGLLGEDGSPGEGGLLGGEGRRPDGYHAQARSHHAVAASVAQGRSDWGMTLDVLAAGSGLGFVFVREERYDVAVPSARMERPAVRVLRELLAAPETRAGLAERGLVP